ncbi:hypothetical protein BDY21DRAFT_341722 [Lineolata rhizophorae]|uniref:Uncharacterized protein n=1 Tax=Lineolata rhizophorae TaxID=578093 RepID=A0A6A6P357_9PEZI|nr:hypothetical protein BDY21DRAFT_341722 [Lineolata rhizophorae]
MVVICVLGKLDEPLEDNHTLVERRLRRRAPMNSDSSSLCTRFKQQRLCRSTGKLRMRAAVSM